MYSLDKKISIKAIEIGSLIEWEGHISAVIYLAGCNFRCPFCHNPDLVLGRGEISIDDLFKSLGNNWLDAVCITGGEPTLQGDLPDLIEDIKDFGLKVHLETNGSNPRMLKDLVGRGLLDYIAMDFKAPTSKYLKIAGVDVKETIEESINFLLEGLVDYEFRTTIVPKLLTVDDLKEIAQRLAKAKRFFIQKFSNKQTLDPAFMEIKTYSPGEMLEIYNLMSQSCPNVRIRGVN